MSNTAADGAAFVALMRRYVVDYTNRHDFGATEAIMEPDYTLVMGEHRVVGRDTAYRDATRRQMTQFPGLGLTVHEIITSGKRLAMRFSEHGARAKDGAECAWGGIGLYAWNGSRLVRNFVEQDYLSRVEQLRTGRPLAVESPARAPWDTVAVAPDPTAETVVRDWLESGKLAQSTQVQLDDGQAPSSLIDQRRITIDDLFSCGDAVAFRVTQHGVLLPDEVVRGTRGESVFLHMTGIVHVNGDRVARGRIIRNRLDLARRLAAD